MSGQQYESLNVSACRMCGAVVSDMGLHDDWHRQAKEVEGYLNRDRLRRAGKIYG